MNHLTVVALLLEVSVCPHQPHAGTVSAERLTVLPAVPTTHGLCSLKRHAATPLQESQHNSVDIGSAVEHRVSWPSITAYRQRQQSSTTTASCKHCYLGHNLQH